MKKYFEKQKFDVGDRIITVSDDEIYGDHAKGDVAVVRRIHRTSFGSILYFVDWQTNLLGVNEGQRCDALFANEMTHQSNQ